MANLTLRNVKGTPLTNNEIDANFTNINDEVGTKLTASNYTAADVLAKLLTVDGTGSGLDASMVDGKIATYMGTPDTVVARDPAGDFTAGVISATLNGNASTVTNGLYSNQLYVDPPWLISLDGSKVSSIPNSSLNNSSVTVNGVTVELGGSIVITAQQQFTDSQFSITDNSDPSKLMKFQLNGISSGTERVMFIPDETGYIATQDYVQSSLSSLYSWVIDYVQTSGRNSQGNKYISSAAPSGGSDGDIWYRI